MISTIRRLISKWTAAGTIHQPHPQSPAPLLLEELEEIVLFNAVPDVTIQTPADDLFIGEDFTFSVAFDNVGTTEGYGPIIDLIFPVNGADGVPPAGTDDGIDIIGSATYLGAPVTTVELTFGVSGEVDHPFLKDASGNPLKVQGNPGDKLVVAQLPFGSFTPGQPPASIQFSADMSNLADLGVSLDFKARGAFMFGDDPLDNTATDPVILSDSATNSSLWTETGSIDPILAKLSKTNLAPESETATGPNFPRTYEIVVEIAEGQTLTDFNLTDLLPPEIVFLGNVQVTAGAGATLGAVTVVDQPPSNTDPHAAPDNNLTLNIASATGGAGNTGFTVTFDFYVNEFNAAGGNVINPPSGNDTITANEVSANFDWDPIHTVDPIQNNVVIHEVIAGVDDELENQSIAVQKGLAILTDNGAPGYSPGDVLEYTLNFQISDYFGFEDVFITDILSDGLRLDGTFTPTLSVSEHGNLTVGGFAGANFTVSAIGVDGSQTLSFRISDELTTRGGSFADGQLVGGAIPNGGTGGGPPPAGAPLPFGGTTGQITYRVVIQDEFDVAPPSGDVSVDQGDVLENNAVIDGAVLNVDDLTPNGNREDDDTAAGLEIVRGAITKTIYAVNGVLAGAGPITVAPGDVVTYRFTATLPNSDVEDLRFVDFLPLPVFSAGEVVTLNNTHSATAPAAGQAHFHTDDTFSGATGLSGIVPTLNTVTVGGENRVEFTYGDYDDPANSSTKIDILFSVTVDDDPFADGLFLTNQVRQEEGSSFNTNKVDDAINQIILSQPVLNITKGVIATDNTGGSFSGAVAPTSVTAPGSGGFRFGGTLNSTNLDTTPLNANLSNIDAGDKVTFAIVVENTGSSRKGAFDVEVRDLLPAGFVIPGTGLNLTVTDGTGATVTYTNVGGGTGLFDLGIRLNDPGATPSSGGALQNDAGAIDGFDATDGRNIIVITYDLVADTSAEPNETIVNTATLQNYAGVEGGTDHTVTDLTDNASVTTDIPLIDKVITGTNQAHTTGNNVAIGEIITYTVTVDLTEGTASGVTFVDTLDRGLAFVGLTSVVTNDAAHVSWSGPATATFAAVGAGADNAGRLMTINFGDVANTDTNNAVAETITITYQAVVINGGSNDRGDLRNNDADWNWAGGNTVSDFAPNARIVEPTLDIAKTIVAATGDAGNAHAVTLVISHTGASDADAFNIAISDALPAGMTVSGPITVTPTAGVTGLVNSSAGNTISVAAASIPDGDTITITFNVTLDATVQPNELITNTADVDWTSLPGNVLATQTTHNTLGVERTSDPSDVGGAVNDYTDSGSDTVLITSPQITKQLISTSISNGANANNQAVIGETAVYEVTITLPEGQTLDAAIVDTLDRGLHFVSLDSITRSNGNMTTTVGVSDFSDVGSFGTSVTGTSATGERLTINLGDLTNVADNVAGDTITLRYTVLIDNVPSNVGAPEAPTFLNNAAEFTWDLFGNTQTTGTVSANNIEVIEPILNVDKSVIVAGAGTTGDSGDTVQYTFVISHDAGSDTDAFDVTFQDALPGVKLDGMTIASATHSASGDISALFEITPGEVLRTLVGSSFDLLEGQTVTIVVTGTLSGAVIPNETVTNTSSIAWTSLDGANPNERTGAQDYNDSDSADITILPPVPQKSIVATSEAHTAEGTADTSLDPRPLAVGEVVRYRLAVTLPEGTSPGYRIIDHLPTGMSLIDPSQVKVSFIADSNVGESVDLAGADNDAVTPSFTLPVARISTVGQDVTFDLGDLLNNDTDLNAETIIIEFNAIVNNAVSNQDTTALDNNFDVEINGSVVASSNTVSGEVVEPEIVDVLKSLLTFNGNEVTYRLTFSNTGTAAAFDINVDDTIPPDLLLQPGTVSVSFSGVAPTFIDNSNATALDIVIDQLAVGQIVTIDYTTTIANSNTTLTNTVDVDYTSLPGDGTTGNPTGSDAPVGSERTGADGPGVGLNNYADTSSLTLGALGDRVWYDIDNDGVQDGSEPGMAGVTVNLLFAGTNGTFGDGDDVAISTVTGTNGVYEFSGLPTGNYRVSVDTGTLPIGGLTESYDLNGIGTPSTTSTTLTAGQVRDDVDFGYTGKGSIGDRVWFDADQDGVQDGGEPGIPNVTVELDVDYDQDGSVDFTLSTTTDASGNYSFDNLPVGDYEVRVTQPAGYDQTFDATGALDNTSNHTLGDGENNTSQDFGYVGQGSIGDRVWLDLDGDGTQDIGEPGIAGRTVQLELDINGDGTTDYTTTTTTGVDGTYSFDDLPPGDYTITVTPPGGVTPTFDNDGTGTANQSQLTLGVNEDNVAQDFGYQGTGSIGDRVWFDADGDGVQDGGEPGLDGVTVELDIDFDGDGTVDATLTDTTDSNGNYLFSGLPAANYAVRVTPTPGLNQTYDASGAIDNRSNVTLAAGANNTSQDFGYRGFGSIGDKVWYDIDADGVQDLGEPGYAGVNVVLEADLNGDSVIDYTTSATTDNNGSYSFTVLPPGAYTITVTQPGGTTQTFDNDGTGTANQSQHNLGVLENNTAQDFGYTGTGSIGDRVWFDSDADGVLDASEPGLEGVTVTLDVDLNLDGIVDVTLTDTTDSNGNYLFSNLPVGSYVVRTTPPAGYVQTYDATGAIDNESQLNLAAGQNNLSHDFGYRGTGSIGDFVWFDADQDGVQDAGEPGFRNVTVQLEADLNGDGTIDFTTTTLTNSTGGYQFINLPPADYTVTVLTTPPGATPTFDADGGLDETSDLTLGIGQNNLAQDFGYKGSGSIGDRVWLDLDGDGTQDLGEPGIVGATVQLDLDLTGDGVADYTTSTVTGPDGAYLFSELPVGDYTITVTQPAGTVQTFDNSGALDNTSQHTLGADEDNVAQDFGYQGTGSIGDRVWFDQDGDGVQDAGENGIVGVDVALDIDFNGDGTVDATLTTTTDQNGNYLFDNLLAADYTVRVTPPVGYVQTFDSDGTATSNASDHTLAAGENNTAQDFGYRGTGSIGDQVWLDLDGDGVQDGGLEVGYPNVPVQLDIDFNSDGTIDQTLNTTTDATGNYSFTNLLPGEYTVTVTPPSGTTQTFDNDGTGTANVSQETLTLGENNTAQDFGYQGTGSIGDRVWFDHDGDGVQDAGENGIVGLTVELDVDLDGDGTVDVTLTDTTDQNGNYLFENLPAADSTVRVTPPAGYVQTFDNNGALDNQSNHTLGAGENNTAQDFGYRGTGSIGDTVWLDLDGDGVQDGGLEIGYPNVPVQLDIDFNSDGTIDQTLNATTDASGNYSFTNLLPGEYTVTVTPPGGTVQTFDNDGTGTANTSDETLAPGENNTAQDFGYQGTGSIGDRVWFDADSDGVQDGGEPGIEGVTVELEVDLDGDGTTDVTLTDTTDGNGNYLFEKLPVGDYTVRVTQPAGYDQTFDNDGTGSANSSDHTLGAGENNVAQDFGYTGQGSIGDRVWFDADQDGIQDGGEPGFPNITVELEVDLNGDGAVDYTTTTTTDNNGNYLFSDLPPGAYTISVLTTPAGGTQTFDADGGLDETSALTLGVNEDNLAQDFGYKGAGSMGDRVWLDLDGDGSQDSGEPGIVGVTVQLDLDLTGDGVADYTTTTVTGPDGQYLFSELPVGDYTISVTQPAGTIQTFDNSGPTNDNSSQHTLGADEDNVVQDFGYQGTGSIGDRVWFDADSDGVQDGGEPGIRNVAVELDIDFNQDGIVDATLSTTTDANGNYLFDHLPVGDYVVRVTEPVGFDQTFDSSGALDNHSAHTLGDGEHNVAQDFGYTGTGSIGDFVWFDADQDGVQDAGEPGFPNVTLELTLDLDGDGLVDYTTTTTTDLFGNYLFDNLPPGAYTVTVLTTPPGGTQTFDADGGLDETSALTLAVDENNLAQDFGYKGAGSIGDRVWLDLDADGVQDANEPGMGGVTVTLNLDLNGDGATDYTTTTLTDPNGNYLFSELPVGDYTIVTSQPSGTHQTFDEDGPLDNQSQHTLGADEDNVTQDFGYQGLGSISGRVAEDANGNKAVDAPEPGFENKLMELQADINGDGIIDFTLQTLTGPNGEYHFGNLPAGEYRVTVVTPPAFREQSADPDGVNDNTTLVTLAPLEDKINVDYGYLTDFQYSTFYDPRYRPELNLFADNEDEPTSILGPLPDPLFTGITEPGATLVLALFDEEGGLLAEKTVQSDAAGNWQVSFSGTTLQQMPHSMRISVTAAVYNTDIDSNFNLRRYFHNVGIGQIFAQFDGSVQKVFASLPSNVLMHMEQADLNPLGFGWHRYSYEHLSSSPTPVED